MTQIENRFKFRSIRGHHDIRKAHSTKISKPGINSPAGNVRLQYNIWAGSTNKEEREKAYEAAKAVNIKHGIKPENRFLSRDQRDLNAMLRHGSSQTKKKGTKITLPGRPKSQPMSELQKAELRMIERAKKAVELLTFGVEDICNARGFGESGGLKSPRGHVSALHMINIINTLCKYSNIPPPTFSFSKQPGMTSRRKCVDCGVFLAADEGSLCIDCRPDTSKIRAQSEQRRQQAAQTQMLERTAKELGHTITNLAKKVSHESDDS